MPNSIKYSTTGDTLSLRKGNFYIGTGDVGKGPTSGTSYWNGITPPSGGYSVYKNKVSGGPAIWTAASDNQLVSLTNNIEGTSFTTVQQCLTYFASQTDKMVLNEDYEGIITNGLVLLLDAGFTPSYPTSGTTWYDMGYSGFNGTLTNGPTYSSLDGGYVSFDGVDDYVLTSYSDNPTYFTIEVTARPKNVSTGTSKVFLGKYNGSGNDYWIGLHGTDSTILWSANGGSVDSDIVANSSTFYNISACVGPSSQKIYVDGLFKKSASTVTTSPGGRLALGVFGENFGFDTNVDISTVRVYNRELNPSEVLQNYNTTISRFNTPNIVKTNLLLNLDSTNSVSYPSTGTVWGDLSGYGNTGTLTNGPTFNSTSKSIVFDGVNDYINIPTFKIPVDSFTCETYFLWSNLGSSRGSLFSLNYNYPTSGYLIRQRDDGSGKFVVWSDYGSESGVFSTNALSSNVWNHVAVVQTNGTCLIYINGVLDSSQSLPNPVLNQSYPILLGTRAPSGPSAGAFLTGNILESRIYNRVLSSSEVSQNYYGGPLVTNGLVMALDASNIVSYPGSGNVWYDLSGNGNHATLYNSPTYNSQGWFSFDGIDDYVRTTNTLNLSTTDKVTVLVIFKPNSYSGGVKLVYEHTANFNSSTGGFLQSYNDNSLGQDNQVFASNRGNASYNIGVWDKSLFNDLTWKFSNCVFDRSQPLVENLFYLQGSLKSAIQNPYPGYTANNTNNYANDYFYIGCRGGSGIFADMNVSAVFIYNRVLTDSEIAQNFNAYKSRFGL